MGTHLSKLLLERDAQVTSFDIIGSSTPGVTSLLGDVCKKEDVLKAAKDMDVVFHAASVIDIRPRPPPSLTKINVEGTRNVVECCKSTGVKVLIYTSSMEVASGLDATGKCPDRLGKETDDETLPPPVKHILPYATTKAEAEKLVLAANSASLRTCALRPGYIVGQGCIGVKVDIEQSIARGDRFVTARFPTKLSCSHVKNCALGHLLAAERAHQPDVGGCPFFITDFEANTVEMSEKALELTGIQTVVLPWYVAYIMALLMDRFYQLLLILSQFLGIAFEIPKTVVSFDALALAWRNICFSSHRAHSVLGYGPRLPGYVSEEACVKETQEWALTYYKELKRSSKSD